MEHKSCLEKIENVVAHAIKDLEDKGITFITNADTLEFKMKTTNQRL